MTTGIWTETQGAQTAIYEAGMRRYDSQTIGSVFKGGSEGANVDLGTLYGVKAANVEKLRSSPCDEEI